MKRKSGVLMPIFSLPSEFSIGDFGESSYNFIDFLEKSKQSVWQVLPLVQTGYGNSPYSSVCSYSFNPYFISVKSLFCEKLITQEEMDSEKSVEKYIDYGKLYFSRYNLLKKAFSRFDKENEEFVSFLKNGKYEDYALFMTIRSIFNEKPFYEWDNDYKYRDKNALEKIKEEYSETFLFWNYLQFECEREWKKVKEYANLKGIEILGDIPLYVCLDSVDVWVNSELFDLDENLKPTKVAGVPPDYFSKEGQLWGNPVYKYSNHEKDGFLWWKNRINSALNIYDLIRIDHFRGLSKFYQIDNFAVNAINGEWVNVPSVKLIDSINQNIEKERIIAEDLGIIDDSVRELLKYSGFPGMKVLSFAFNGDKDNLYLPENIEENSVCYTGTHDNDTLKGLIENFSKWDYDNLINGVKESLTKNNLNLSLSDTDSVITAIKELGFNSKAKLFVMPYADIVNYGSEYRINQPGVLSDKNWSVRFFYFDFNESISEKLKELTFKYNR